MLNAEAAAECFLEAFSSSTDPGGCENVVVARSSSAIVIFSVGVDVSKVGVSDLRTSCLFVFLQG